VQAGRLRFAKIFSAMQRLVLLTISILSCAGFLAPTARSAAAATAAPTPPPQIYRVVTSAFCARIHERVRPSVGMILQNDTRLAKGPPLFKKYQRGALSAQSGTYANGSDAPTNGDSIYVQSPEGDMALQQASYLVIPTARNIIAAQTLLGDPKMLEPTGSPSDDATLAKIKAQLMETIAFQSASLDLINGFVETQQMGELQHAGEEYLGAIQGNDTGKPDAINTPNPWQDPNTPGLPQNPYIFDPSTIPGLSVGYNPLSRIVDALGWLATETQKREDAAAKTISDALRECGT
jgi:hypothetical protein